MMAKLTAKNQITLPKAVVRDFVGIQYFEVKAEGGRIVLTPVNLGLAEAVRAKLGALSIKDSDIKAAVKWARK